MLNLKPEAETISKQLGARALSAQNSGMRSERYVTDKARKKDEASRQRKAFLEKLNQIWNQESDKNERPSLHGMVLVLNVKS